MWSYSAFKSLNSTFNRILSSGKYPSEWCLGYICPIYKKGNKEDPLNYRGLKKGSKPIYLCFVDFKKAFDTVWHNGLFFKLRQIGISDMFYTILKDMYNQTKLCVKVNHQITDFFGSDIGSDKGIT